MLKDNWDKESVIYLHLLTGAIILGIVVEESDEIIMLKLPRILVHEFDGEATKIGLAGMPWLMHEKVRVMKSSLVAYVQGDEIDSRIEQAYRNAIQGRSCRPSQVALKLVE